MRWIVLSMIVVFGRAESQVDVVDFEDPEGWGMARATAATLFLGAAVPDETQPGEWSFSAELSHIPEVDEEDQRVGFDGTKIEDLNKSPVFGRGRLTVGLPSDLTRRWDLRPGLRPTDFHRYGLSCRRSPFRPVRPRQRRYHLS